MNKKIYVLSTCSTCKRILKELDCDSLEVQDIKKQPITKKQLEEMYALAGTYESLFSRKAMKYRSLGLNNMELTEEDYKKYILEEYTFLKRPVAIVGDKIFIGNTKAVVADLKASL